MARRKPASKTGRTSASPKSAKKSAGKPAKRAAAAAQLGPERALGPSLDSVATVIANLKALSAAPGAESVQADIGSAVSELESAHTVLKGACRRARRVGGSD